MISCFSLVAVWLFSVKAADLALWYKQPAKNAMTEGLPVGNGRLGGLVLGEPDRERIVLDEDSLWTGDENPSGNYETMGAYQFCGDLLVNLPSHKMFSCYRRDLDISRALAHVSYTSNGIHYEQECFCSHPAGVMVIHFDADVPAAYTGSIELLDSHGAETLVKGNELVFAGALRNGLKYECRLVIVPDGGSVSANGSMLAFTNCNSFTLFLAAGTDYAMNSAMHFRGSDPRTQTVAALEGALRKSYDELKSEHVRDFQCLFDRVSVNCGVSSDAQRALPTDKRRIAAGKTLDPGLEVLLFQYGRYLMISCSRTNGLPANLQGLWNDSNNPPWHSDYHANINIEMNYWPAEVANLSGCQLPLFNLVESQLPAWRKASDESPDLKTPGGKMTSRGFAVRTSHNIFGGMGWKWDKTANAWYCQDFWEHFAFTRDTNFLRTVAFPIMKETCEFWKDHLKTSSDGKLVVPDGWSPEHGPVQDGVNYNQEIVWDLFDNTVHACDALGMDTTFRNQIAAVRDKLATPGIGSWGQLLEWMHELHDPKHPELDTPNDHHRHTSHLFAVYPGHEISVDKTPTLAKAAKVSLDARGITGDVREWSLAWRCALYARLYDGEDAHKMVQDMFAMRDPKRHEYFTCPNLFGFYPPMQIDGDFGITAGVCEMLLQSQDGYLDLLPALPPEWPAGSAKGLQARGGFVVDETWRRGKLASATIHSTFGGSATVRYGTSVKEFQIKPGQAVNFFPNEKF